jgi:primosomal replication protein N
MARSTVLGQGVAVVLGRKARALPATTLPVVGTEPQGLQAITAAAVLEAQRVSMEAQMLAQAQQTQPVVAPVAAEETPQTAVRAGSPVEVQAGVVRTGRARQAVAGKSRSRTPK